MDQAAVASVDIPRRDFGGIYRHFYPPEGVKDTWRIRHFRELKNKKKEVKDRYLCEFRQKLEEAKRKFDIDIKYYPQPNAKFWNLVYYALENYDEVILDKNLYHNYKHKLSLENAQIDIILDGDITEKIAELKSMIEDEKNKKWPNYKLIENYERDLWLWQGRWVLVMIADNYLAYKRRSPKCED